MKHLYILLALILSASVSFAQLTADAGADIAICEGSSQQLGGTPTATGGTAPYHYVWTPSAGLDNDTIANPLAIPGTTTTYVLTVTDDLSATATDEIVITVKPIPIAAASPSSQTICSGETTNISLSSNVGATSYAWTYSSSGPISGASNGSGNQISQYLTNSGNVPGSVTYHITPTADGCIGNQSDITVFVNPTPNAVASPSIQSICSGGCTSISLSSDVTGTTFSFSYWYNGSSQGTGNIIYKCFVNDGIYTDSIQFTITPTYNGCEGQPIHAYAAVLPKPVAYASPSSQIIDDGDTSHISLSSNMAGTTFTWTVSENGTGGATAGSGNIIEQQLHYANPPAIATYLIRPRKSGCYGNIIQATVQVRECSDCGVLSGLIYDDINNNGVRDAGEEGVPGIIVKATPFNSYTISDSTGNFSMFHSTGNITVSIPNPPLYHLVTTPPYSMNLTSIGLPNLDFGIHKLQNINDLKINYLCASASRPGFNTSINVSYKNNGTEVANGYVELQYDTICEFVSSQIIPTSHISNILTWDFSNLEPGESRNTNVTLNIPPTTPIGTVLHYEASVYPIIGDTTPPDNVKQLIETVTGSFDPNDKQADPLQISPGMLANNQEVTYTIRFQNTGNDTAFNVHIIDTLSANLDIPTFEFLSASHPYTVDISGQGIIDFTFSNILLPDSTTDETNSHGFVSYSVRPLDTLELGETVENTAYIYFDFNEAVQTNIVSTEIADNPMIIDAGHDTIICRHDTIQLGGTPTVTGGTPPYHYVWTPSAGLENDTIANPTALPTLTTVYSLTVTDSLGATASNTITISIPNPNAIATPVSDTICSGESTNFALSSDSAGASFSWTAVNGTGIIAGYLAGTGDSISQVLINPATMVGIVTYMVVPEINGCSGDTTDIIVVVGPPADASVYPMNAAICSGDSTHFDIFSQTGNTTLTWTASATGGISGAYDSSGNVISQLLENPGTVTGEVTYTITPITEFGCSGWPATATVSVNPIPQISTSGDICALPGQVVTLYASGATTYTWAPAYGLSSTSGSCIFANIGASIVYSVTGSTYGCSSTSTLQVTVPTSPFILADAGPSQTINCGGSGVIIGTPDTIGCTYSWSPTSGLSNPNIAQPTAAPSGTTVYSLTCTSPEGCSWSDTVTVQVLQTPIADAGIDETNGCDGTPIEIGTPGEVDVSYNWAPPTGLSSPDSAETQAAPSATTTYTLTATSNINGCYATDAITVTLLQLPVADAGPDKLIDCGETYTTIGVAPSSGCTYFWAPWTSLDDPNTAAPHASPGITSTYTLTVLSPEGCSASDAVTVTVNQSAFANAGSDRFVCTGDTLSLSATANGSILWNTGDTTASISVAPASSTFYTVTVTNGCGTATDTVGVTVTSSPMIDAGQDTSVCDGSSVLLTINSTGTSFLWSTGETTQNITVSPDSATEYYVTANASCGSTSDTVLVFVKPAPIISAIPLSQEICTNTSTSIGLASDQPGTTFFWPSPQQSSWVSGGYASSGSNISQLLQYSGTNSGTATYTVSAIADGCYSNPLNIVVTIEPMPTPNVGSNQTICPGDSAELTLTGQISGSVLWNTGDTTLSITVWPTADSVFYASISSVCGLFGDSITVFIQDTMWTNAGTDTNVCQGNSVILHASSLNATTYTWSTGQQQQNIFVSPANSTLYYVTASNNCYSAIDSVHVEVLPLPNIVATGTTTTCAGSYIPVMASGGVHYHWSPYYCISNPNVTYPTVYPSNTTIYTVTGTDIHGCINSDSITITVLPRPTVDAGPNVTVCAGTPASLSASGSGISYHWSTGETTDSITVNPTFTTTYTVTTTGSNGCSAKDWATVYAINAGNGTSAGYDKFTCIGHPVFLTANCNSIGLISYQWSPATGLSSTVGKNVTATPLTTTTYTVTSSDTCGNSSSDAVTVSVYQCGHISGTVYNDINANGVQDAGENGRTGVMVKVNPGPVYLYPNYNGDYGIDNRVGINTVAAPNPPLYHIVTNPQYTVNLDTAGYSDLDFGIHRLPNVQDLRLTSLNIATTRPGFNTTVCLSYRNDGTIPMNGYVELKYDTTCEFVTTYYPPSSQTGNVLTWNFSNLQPGYVGYKSIELNVPSFLAVGTTLHFEATVFPVVNDTVPSNNFAYNNPVVTGSYDPNDKLADPELITPDMLDEELPVTYTIRFQNTGNDTAFNVQIIDTLSENLDIPTFELLGSSHPCSVDISGKGIIEFSFNNILLPDSTTDEMNSHGFVRYSVKPIDTLALGETVVNTAYIYFDFNEAIVTNTVVSEVRDTLVAIPVFRSGAKASLTVFPNPYRDETNIQYSLLESGIVSLEVFDIVGKNVATLHDGWQESGQYSYIFSAKQLGLPSGIYVVKLNMSDGCVSRKIVEMR